MFTSRMTRSGAARSSSVSAACASPDPPAFRRVLDRILEHVAEGGLQRGRIRGDGKLRPLRDELQAQPAAVGEPVGGRERAEDLDEVRAALRTGREGAAAAAQWSPGQAFGELDLAREVG